MTYEPLYKKDGDVGEITGLRTGRKPIGLDLEPAIPMDFQGLQAKPYQGMDRAMGLARSMQPNIPEPEPTIGQGLMTGLGGAAAGATVATTAFKGAAAAGPWGAAIGTGVGLLSAFG